MTETWRPAPEDPGTLEVRVYQHGRLLHREVCESDEDAALVVDQWRELPDVTCEVDDLSVRHDADDILEPEPAEPFDEDYTPGPAK